MILKIFDVVLFQLLSKARGMIFDKTKMVKNQELQIEALTTQVQSLKDINVITKDLLEIRNSEVKAMEVGSIRRRGFLLVKGVRLLLLCTYLLSKVGAA